ncbi:hypothetical protein A3I18_01060 [Candidatus Campbellbacteria bacterium RIFCSPLOWO2_02_FULL_35_11]|uniref:RecF/RecN/SMC N-terminal domain-containing protein n=2 Tax=Candidatus Campbelliibacteriota TaxID=1752727 RepID=A0A1F5EKG3_9BACT|nr:MAG: hypothetical protein A3E89_02305 [Candidatus Campbellbacteria bacterium RIFCSPHIGHO2_12_FULL_35_10]OGD69694.1 MAG: hypothetical protein A3I18_01060 [Candidatus Campbellbacteria bacterium RIFCSPLOWO2_02_FULL_35_11]
MYLKSLEISGFKSFAKKESLDFTSPISAIVGPNGSGKSNVAEAFRFVLGEQSLKSLRGKRGEDMIFSGSKNERSLNRASVKVVFDNITRFLNIDFDEVIIERVVHKDGVNQYSINGTQVRLKDIIELLAGANIGSSGHHIISQGEADRILSVNIKERRGMIEDALGLKVYQYKISESEKKLDKVEENLKSVESLRREIKPHLKFLEKQIKKIEQSAELKDKLRDLYKEYFKREDTYLKHQKNYIRVNKLPLDEKLRELNEDLVDAKEILKKEAQPISEESSLVMELEEKLSEIRKKKSDLTRELGQMEGMIVFEERRIKREESRQREEEDRVIRFKDVKNFLSELQEELNSYGNLNVVEALERVKKSINHFIERNSKDNASVEIDFSEVEKLKREKSELEERLRNVVVNERDLSQKYDQAKSQFEKEKDSGRQAELKIFEINAKKAEVEARLNSINELDYKIKMEDENFKRELNEAFVLAGRESTQFFDFQITEDEVMAEPRRQQFDRGREIEKIKIKLEDMGAGSDEEILKEYKEVRDRDEFLEREIEDLTRSAISLKDLIVELKGRLDVEFKDGVEKINKQFNEFFALMFGGGRAEMLVVRNKKRKKSDTELELGDDSVEETEEEDSEEGIDINVALPNKKTKGLQMLSGGERSLTSIALLFAMSQIKPPPFIILDETDAALDEANSRRYGDMITSLSKYSQLILITHNRETMSRAGVLYGITMGMDGVSRLLSVKLEEAVKVAK